MNEAERKTASHPAVRKLAAVILDLEISWRLLEDGKQLRCARKLQGAITKANNLYTEVVTQVHHDNSGEASGQENVVAQETSEPKQPN
jgi:exonuclease VII small subunit